MGTSTASMSSTGTVIRPSPASTGTLTMFTIAKNQAAVPRKTFTGVCIARKYIDITGPPALATMVVKPPSAP